MHFRYDQNLLFLWFFLIFQVLVLLCYLKFSSTWNNHSNQELPRSVKFVQVLSKNSGQKFLDNENVTYCSAEAECEVYLKTENVEDYFLTVNNAICFKPGTDIEYMKRNMDIIKDGKCECLPEYHGNDCSLPEVIWRAFIAFRKETIIHKRNKKGRRVMHIFQITHPAQIPLAVLKINELFEVVDLFIVIETNKTEFGESKPFHFKLKLDKGLLKEKQYKIIHSPVYVEKVDLKNTSPKSPSEISWKRTKKIIKNLKDDDLLIQLNALEIPNPKALLFFKLFDGFSLPLQFRLKWNVYGYFFQHPNKTRKITTGSTVQMLEEVFKNDPGSIENARGLVIGDLNHYGGWFCDLCFDVKEILNVIQNFNEFEEVLTKVSKVIDVKYLEDLIGDGIYVDGKTSLISNHEDRDPYFSPDYVAKNSWKFDSLMINFYNKIDYN